MLQKILVFNLALVLVLSLTLAQGVQAAPAPAPGPEARIDFPSLLVGWDGKQTPILIASGVYGVKNFQDLKTFYEAVEHVRTGLPQDNSQTVAFQVALTGLGVYMPGQAKWDKELPGLQPGWNPARDPLPSTFSQRRVPVGKPSPVTFTATAGSFLPTPGWDITPDGRQATTIDSAWIMQPGINYVAHILYQAPADPQVVTISASLGDSLPLTVLDGAVSASYQGGQVVLTPRGQKKIPEASVTTPKYYVVPTKKVPLGGGSYRWDGDEAALRAAMQADPPRLDPDPMAMPPGGKPAGKWLAKDAQGVREIDPTRPFPASGQVVILPAPIVDVLGWPNDPVAALKDIRLAGGDVTGPVTAAPAKGSQALAPAKGQEAAAGQDTVPTPSPAPAPSPAPQPAPPAPAQDTTPAEDMFPRLTPGPVWPYVGFAVGVAGALALWAWTPVVGYVPRRRKRRAAEQARETGV